MYAIATDKKYQENPKNRNIKLHKYENNLQQDDIFLFGNTVLELRWNHQRRFKDIQYKRQRMTIPKMAAALFFLWSLISNT
jgi:hypothetical protein